MNDLREISKRLRVDHFTFLFLFHTRAPKASRVLHSWTSSAIYSLHGKQIPPLDGFELLIILQLATRRYPHHSPWYLPGALKLIIAKKCFSIANAMQEMGNVVAISLLEAVAD